MKMRKSVSGCSCCGVSRRQFLAAGCAACAGVAGFLANSGRLHADQDDGKERIRIIYSLHAPKQPGQDWPNIGFDFRPVMKRHLRSIWMAPAKAQLVRGQCVDCALVGNG